jgi:hypothetical protein
MCAMAQSTSEHQESAELPRTPLRRSSIAKGIASVRSTGHLRTVAPIYSVTEAMRTSGGFSAAYPALYLR